jgi:hypothetical protein
MNKIVRRHYPVGNLPTDLQTGLPQDGLVTVELEIEEVARQRQPIAHLAGSGSNIHGSPEDVIRHIRELREDR